MAVAVCIYIGGCAGGELPLLPGFPLGSGRKAEGVQPGRAADREGWG